MSELGLMDQEPRGRRAERNNRRRRRKQGKRNGCACLAVAVVLVGGLGVGGWYAYDFYQDRFGPAPDYSGKGSGAAVSVEVGDGFGASQIGAALEKAGVVKSDDAFTDMANKNPGKAGRIQPGVYGMHKKMSAAAAFDVLTNQKNLNTLTIPEGRRVTQVYQAIDQKLKLAAGSTAKAAKKADLGLPDYAQGNPEGFLFPSRYNIGPKSSPAELLTQMVKRANSEYAKVGLDAAAKKLKKSPFDVIKIASLIQAEAQADDEFGKVSRVVENRLRKGMMLQFDSTINYALNRSTLTTTREDLKLDSPYNTYKHTGLPPGPIGNPGHQAIEAAINPTPGPWLYFVSIKPGLTKFTDDANQHEKNVQEFNKYQREHGKG
jgi:UPF0755 protein